MIGSPKQLSPKNVQLESPNEEIFKIIKSDKNYETLAQQITKVESQLFYKIQPSELFDNHWQDTKEKAPTICSLIDRFNKTSDWVATLIFMAESQDVSRTKVIAFFIEIVGYLHQFHNYNGIMAIMAALHREDVQKLTEDWAVKSISPKFFSEN